METYLVYFKQVGITQVLLPKHGNGHLSGVLQIGAGNMSTVTQTGGGPTLD